MRSFYDILGAEPSCSQDELKKAYFTFLRRVHPDKGIENDSEAVTLGGIIWNTLKEPSKRQEYDHWYREQTLRSLKGTIVESIEISSDGEIDECCRCGDYYMVSPEEIAQIVDVGVFECASCSLCLEVIKKDPMQA